jgi:general secretion pathway protein F
MVSFNYIASDKAGKNSEGIIEADSEILALSAIEKLGLIPLEVSKDTRVGNNWLTGDISFGSRNISLEKQAQLALLLSTLFAARLPVETALRMATQAGQPKKVSSFLERAVGVVEGGGTLEDAFALSNSGLSIDFKTYIAIGDKTNALPETLLNASKLFNLRAVTRSKVGTALIYPSILVIASLSLIALMVFFLVPTLSPIFKSANVEPPILFVLSEALSGFASRFAFFALFLLLALFAILMAWKQTKNGRVFFNQLIFRLPLIGRIARTSQLMVDVKFLSMLIESGETISEGFAKVAQTSQLSIAARTYQDVGSALKEGETVNSVITGAKAFPTEFKAFFKIAEETNRWPELMDSLADLLQTKADKQRDRMLQVLTPAITVTVGLLIGFLVYSILASILQINDLAIV